MTTVSMQPILEEEKKKSHAKIEIQDLTIYVKGKKKKILLF